jgi:hypothetical protein
MCHNIVTTFLFFFCSNVKLLRCKILYFQPQKVYQESKGVSYEIRLHLLKSFITDRKPELFFCDGEVEPQFSPGFETILDR